MKKFLFFLVALLPNFVLAQYDDSHNLGQDSDPIRNYSVDDPLTGQHHDRVIRYGDYKRGNSQDFTGLWPKEGIQTSKEDYSFTDQSSTNRSGEVSRKKINNLEYKVNYGQNKHRNEINALDGRVTVLEDGQEVPEQDSGEQSDIQEGEMKEPESPIDTGDVSSEPIETSSGVSWGTFFLWIAATLAVGSLGVYIIVRQKYNLTKK